MKKEQLTNLGISNELVEKILNIYKESIKEFIPKHRFDEVNTQKQTLNDQLNTANAQIESLKTLATDNESMKTQIENYQKDFKIKDSEYKLNMLKLAKNNLIKLSLLSMEKRPYDVEIVSKLIDNDKIILDDKNEKIVSGLQEQIDTITKDKPFLFSVGAGDSNPSGRTPPDGNNNTNSISDFGKQLALSKLDSMGIKTK